MNGKLTRTFCAAAAGLALAASGLAGAGAAAAGPETGGLQAPSRAAVPAGFEPAAASFLSPARGVVLGGTGCAGGQACRVRLAATADGGAHWHYLTAPAISLYGPVSRVLFATARDGWLWGPALWSTHDGGAHWRKLSPGGAVKSMAASAGRVYAVVAPPGGSRSELLTSPAGRDAWARVGQIAVQPFTGLAVSGSAAWLAGRSHLWATADGVHWHRYPFRCPAPYNIEGLASITAASPSDVFFLCLSDAAMAQQGKAVLFSANGGRTEHLAGSAPTSGVGGVIAVPPRRPRVITLAAEYSIDRSADGGKTWSAKYVGIGGGAPWNSLAYVSRTAGWAEVGSPPYSGLLRTTDAGRTWHQVRFVGLHEPVTAYVANSGSGTVTAISTATSRVLKTIKVGFDDTAIAITPDGGTAYVVSPDCGPCMTARSLPYGTVTPIDTAANKALKAIKVDGSNLAITPDGKTAYVLADSSPTGSPSHAVIPIRTATNTAGKAIRVGSGPDAIAITPDGRTAYVANGRSGTVTPIRTATNKALAPITVGSGPDAVAITPDGRTAYVANGRSGTVTPIRTATNKALAPIRVGSGPDAVAITPDGRTAYVANGRSGTVTPIRTATNAAGRAIGVGHLPLAIAITPDGRTAYVANWTSGTVTPIRTATGTALKAITTGTYPDAIAITPDGSTAYVPNFNSSTVTLIDTATSTVSKTIKVDAFPAAVAITP